MKANDVREMLSETDIISLLEELGAEPKMTGNAITSRTICHNPAHTGKHKLVYYPETKCFHCYTGCGTIDIFGLVGKVLDLDFYSSFRYVCMKFGISYIDETIGFDDKIDTSFFKKFKKQKETMTLNKLPKGILNSYYHLYHHTWIEEGISIETMKKFGIRFCISNNQIIIPHFDINSNLIGVRARNLNDEEVEAGKKYMPIYHKGVSLKHPTGANLYGLNLTKKHIEKYKTVILFESEKSVMQLDTMFPDKSIGVCISGSSLTTYQLEILKTLDIEEVVIALDKEYEEIGSDEEKFYAQKIKSIFIDKLIPYFKCSVIWDTENLLSLKDSPTDKGKEVFNELFQKRIFI